MTEETTFDEDGNLICPNCSSQRVVDYADEFDKLDINQLGYEVKYCLGCGNLFYIAVNNHEANF
ncbi:hypothetical protein IQ243_25760 [Nostocales cyanobacterium LEGE 11386]|nr:hypothetical protein [Nostocales cyanobacterium LEGE 11386]